MLKHRQFFMAHPVYEVEEAKNELKDLQIHLKSRFGGIFVWNLIIWRIVWYGKKLLIHKDIIYPGKLVFRMTEVGRPR